MISQIPMLAPCLKSLLTYLKFSSDRFPAALNFSYSLFSSDETTPLAVTSALNLPLIVVPCSRGTILLTLPKSINPLMLASICASETGVLTSNRISKGSAPISACMRLRLIIVLSGTPSGFEILRSTCTLLIAVGKSGYLNIPSAIMRFSPKPGMVVSL